MSHWFLCARDVMWVFIAMIPLALSVYSSEGNDFNPLFLAVVIQAIGIGCLYLGVIK